MVAVVVVVVLVVLVVVVVVVVVAVPANFEGRQVKCNVVIYQCLCPRLCPCLCLCHDEFML